MDDESDSSGSSSNWLNSILSNVTSAYNARTTQDAAKDAANQKAKTDLAKAKAWTTPLLLVGGGLVLLAIVFGVLTAFKKN